MDSRTLRFPRTGERTRELASRPPSLLEQSRCQRIRVARHFSLGRSRWSLVGGLRLAAAGARSARGASQLPRQAAHTENPKMSVVTVPHGQRPTVHWLPQCMHLPAGFLHRGDSPARQLLNSRWLVSAALGLRPVAGRKPRPPFASTTSVRDGDKPFSSLDIRFLLLGRETVNPAV